MAQSNLQDMIDQINALMDAETVLFKINYKVDAMVQSGNTIKSYCPIHQETMIRSLNIDPNRRRFRCSYSNCPGNRGGTFFELYRLVNQLEPEECVRVLCNELGIQTDLIDSGKEFTGMEKDRQEEIQDFSTDSAKTLSEVEEKQGELEQEFDTEESLVDEVLAESLVAGELESKPEEESIVPEPGSEPFAESNTFDEYLDAATSAFESNKYRQAREDFEQAMNHAPGIEERIHCEVMRARCMMHLKKTNEALDILQRTSEDPDLLEDSQKEVLYRMAEALERMGQSDKAAEVLGRLIQKYGAYRDSDSRVTRLKQQKPDTGEAHRDQRISFI